MLDSAQFVPAETASVWLQPDQTSAISQPTPSFDTLFSVQVSLLGPPLEDFFFRKLPEIVHRGAFRDVPWHYNALCRGCDFESKCRGRALSEKTIGAMPNISLGEASTLKSLIDRAVLDTDASTQESSPGHITDLEDLDMICRDREILARLIRQLPTTSRAAKRILNLPIKASESGNIGSSRVTAALIKLPQVG